MKQDILLLIVSKNEQEIMKQEQNKYLKGQCKYYIFIQQLFLQKNFI